MLLGNLRWQGRMDIIKERQFKEDGTDSPGYHCPEY